ncbi:MAG: proline--tRNA ligase, partial [Legionellales bacterium]|nr:proline--tRNA ligase [Legionellales bacterium]
MRYTSLYSGTRKETPKDAEITSHRLMIQTGMIKKLSSGLYTWMPIGLKVLQKISDIIREEMSSIGFSEILMPAVQPAGLWKQTERWDKYGPLLLKIQDRHKKEYCYGPTHEEIGTYLIKQDLNTYKDLPITVYQIQTKFRDEIRPRYGIMRSREFSMKDGYSFHQNQESLQETYTIVMQAYHRMFAKMGLNVRSVLADTGSIGGETSHEFHVLADAG